MLFRVHETSGQSPPPHPHSSTNRQVASTDIKNSKCLPYTITISCCSVDNEVSCHCVLVDAPCVRSSQNRSELIADHVHRQRHSTNVVTEGIIIRFDHQLKKNRKRRKPPMIGCASVAICFSGILLLCHQNQQTNGINSIQSVDAMHITGTHTTETQITYDNST